MGVSVTFTQSNCGGDITPSGSASVSVFLLPVEISVAAFLTFGYAKGTGLTGLLLLQVVGLPGTDPLDLVANTSGKRVA